MSSHTVARIVRRPRFMRCSLIVWCLPSDATRGATLEFVAAKLGIDDPQTSGKCLKCHSTAYFFTETLQSEAVAVEDGVSCESCHGPGADYKKKSIMQSREESIANGMVYPALVKSCTQCHNDTGPTWDPERYTTASGEKTGFDPVQAYEKIKHERPAAE